MARKTFKTVNGLHTFEKIADYQRMFGPMVRVKENHPRHGERTFVCTPRQWANLGEE